MVLTVDEGFQRDILGQQRFQGLVQVCFDFGVDVVTFFFDTVVGADTYGLAVSTDSDDTDIGIAELAGNQFAYLFGFYLVLELYLEVTSTGEVDALAQTADAEEADANYNCYTCQRHPEFVSAHEVEVYIRHQVLGDSRRECQVQQLVFVHEVFVEQTCHEHSGKE